MGSEKRGGPRRGVSILTWGHRLLVDPPNPQPSLRTAAHHLIPLHEASRGPVWRKRAAISRFSRQTWQRDLARAENREFAGVLERGLVS